MKLHYYPETGSLYIELASRPGAETRKIANGLNEDLDAEGAAATRNVGSRAACCVSHSTPIRLCLVEARIFVPMTSAASRRGGGLCQEDARASCCTRDGGGPFEVALTVFPLPFCAGLHQPVVDCLTCARAGNAPATISSRQKTPCLFTSLDRYM